MINFFSSTQNIPKELRYKRFFIEKSSQFKLSSADFDLYLNHFTTALFEYGFEQQEASSITKENILPMRPYMVSK